MMRLVNPNPGGTTNPQDRGYQLAPLTTTPEFKTPLC